MNLDILQNIRVVLCQPSHPGNIGAAARAMKTMGLNRLYLVNPRSFPNAQADALAAGATDVLEAAVICTDLDEALRDCTFAVAMTARRRDLSGVMVNSREATPIIIEEAQKTQVALVFGTEMSGLTNEETSRCQLLAHIPAAPEFSSLNLAAAVQIMVYELRMALPDLPVLLNDEYEAATFEEIELFFGHLEQTMIATGFLNPEEPKRLMQRMRRLFSRTRLEKVEINILRGILSRLK